MMLFIILTCWLSFFSVTDVDAIQNMIVIKQNAVNAGNQSAFMSTIFPDEHYQQEQKRWFHDSKTYIDPNSFHLQIKNYKKITKDRYRVLLLQSYRNKKKTYSLTYSIEVKKSRNAWNDPDSLAYECKKESIKIKYSDPLLRVQATKALDILTEVAKVFSKKYNWNPALVEAKLYQNPEVFRQSVKLSLPYWAGGWNEAKQSIKLVASQADIGSLRHGLAHEYTHQLLSDITNDNASYWLQEGAAMYYEALLTGERPPVEIEFKPYSISQLEKMNLEGLGDKEASRYYLSCYVQFQKLMDKFGEKKLANVLRQLHQYPYIDVDSANKQAQTNHRTSIILKKNKVLTNENKHFEDAYRRSSSDNKIL